MRKMLFVVWLWLAGCTDTEMAQWGALGNPHEITCYSGGVIIYQGTSTGKVLSSRDSDGWSFKDAKTGRLVEVSGACVLVTDP